MALDLKFNDLVDIPGYSTKTASYEWRIGIGKQGTYTMEELLGELSGDGSIIRVFFSGIRFVY